MDVTGLEEAADHAELVTLSDAVVVKCVSVPGLVLLKILAFLDRSRRGHPKHRNDAQDIYYWMKYYAYAADDERRYTMLGASDAGISYPDAGAALLGRDIRSIASSASIDRIEAFLKIAAEEDGAFLTSVHQRALFDEEERLRVMDEASKLLKAFAWGFILLS